VVDSYAALTDARPFRAALTVEAARRELIDRAGIEFDPNVVNVFLKLDGLPELESFAKSDMDEPVEEPPAAHKWDMFSSFSK
jgi:HD-GYP domain-containing protein (c-di-GMP phosphodiesterase class II)